MSISNETITTIAELARLEFSETEKAQFIPQFEKIIEYFNAIEAMNLEGVEPLKTIVGAEDNVFRPDEVERPITTAEALSNAPKHNDVFFKVPKVLG